LGRAPGLTLGLANFKLIPVSLLPFGREIVSIDPARAMGLVPGIVVGADPFGTTEVSCVTSARSPSQAHRPF
jgi:hypothetical protein